MTTKTVQESLKTRGLGQTKTRSKNGGSALHVLVQQGGYRINRDGTISFSAEIMAERKLMVGCKD